MAGETIERYRVIAAPPEEVWKVLSDLRRMAEWSKDVDSIELLCGDGATVGSRFMGNNQDETRTWSMVCVVDECEPGRRLEFHTETPEGEARTRWWYEIEATADGGSRVTEGFLRLATLTEERARRERALIGDITEYNATNIDESLRQLATLIER